jgi:hypothetical protein
MIPQVSAATELNGKRPAPVAGVYERNGSRNGDAETVLTQKILEIKEIPGIEKMKDVSFFELGLGSFDVANLSAELEIIYPELVVGDIFKHPTIRTLSAHLNETIRFPAHHGQNWASAGDCLINFELFRT